MSVTCRSSVVDETEAEFLASQKQQLATRTKAELQNELKRKGIKITGNKSSLIAKVLEEIGRAHV